jgi:hypothetical protein
MVTQVDGTMNWLYALNLTITSPKVNDQCRV